MADTVLNSTVFDGTKKLITHYNVVSDSTGGTTTIVDVSALQYSRGGTVGSACAKVRLVKINFNVSITAPVDAIRLAWDADTDVVFQTLAGEMAFDYTTFGGLKNTEATGYTGDVNLTLPACSNGDTGTVVCEWIKVYD